MIFLHKIFLECITVRNILYELQTLYFMHDRIEHNITRHVSWVSPILDKSGSHSLNTQLLIPPQHLLFFQLQPEQLNCGAAHLQHPLALRKPLRVRPIYEAPGLSSVAVDSVHNHTVVFLGTSNGRLCKVSYMHSLEILWILFLYHTYICE